MLLKLLFTILLIGLFTTNITSRILSLSPNNPHVIHRNSIKEAHYANKVEKTRERRGTNITTELIHTITTLEGDAHYYALIHWSGLKRSNVVFILTFDYSADSEYGISESTLWRSSDYGKTFSSQTSKFHEGSIIDYFAIPDTDHTNLVLGDSTNGFIYVSKDEGGSYTQVANVGFYWFDFYPGSDTVLAAYKSEGSLLGSNDGGINWYNMLDGVEKYEFRDQVTNSMFIITTDKKLYTIEIDNSNSMKKEFDTNLGSVMTSYLTKAGDYLFVQKESTHSSVELWVSHLGGPFRKCLFPSASYVANQTYYITSVHNRQLLVLLSNYGLAYADIHVVNGMNGTIIANVFSSGYLLNTMITYDSGGEWSRLASASSECYLPDCSLNFLLSLSAYFNRLQTTLFSK